MDIDALGSWMEAYGRAWISNDPADVAALFTEDAVYHYGPYGEPSRGRDAIVERWVSDPMGQHDIRFHSEPLAVAGDLGVGHWSVSFVRAANPSVRTEIDGILVLRFDEDGGCREHREWYAMREVTTG